MMKRELIDGNRIFIIHDFLSPSECERHVERSEAMGYEKCTVDGEVFPGFRDNARLILDDADLAETLWQMAAEHLPPVIESLPDILISANPFARMSNNPYQPFGTVSEGMAGFRATTWNSNPLHKRTGNEYKTPHGGLEARMEIVSQRRAFDGPRFTTSNYASMALMTWPWTSVKRRSRPL